MKTVKWQKCLLRGRLGSYSSVEGMLHSPHDNVIAGMHIDARYKEQSIHILVKEELTDNRFYGEILFFEPVHEEKPHELEEGDFVFITREDICWIYDN